MTDEHMAREYEAKPVPRHDDVQVYDTPHGQRFLVHRGVVYGYVETILAVAPLPTASQDAGARSPQPQGTS